MKKLALSLLFLLAWVAGAAAQNCSSYPYTLTNGQVASATQVMADFNLILNCANNNLAGAGANTNITSLTGLTTPLAPGVGGTPVFIGGSTAGTANAQTLASVTPSNFLLTQGYMVVFTAGATNTGATTLNVNGTGVINLQKVLYGAPAALAPGDVTLGTQYVASYDGTEYLILNVGPQSGAETTIASATTTDLGSVVSHNIIITGTTTITSLGTSASLKAPYYFVRFGGALLLTYNATSLILPGLANITTAAGDWMVAEELSSGNWQVVIYSPATGLAVIPSATSGSASGLKVVNDASTPNTVIDISATNVTTITSTGLPTFTASPSAAINFATTGANGLDAGSIASNTWYYVYFINGANLRGLGSLSATAPTLPTGYTSFYRVGAVRTDGSSHFLRTLQQGRRAQYTLVGSSNTTVYPPLPTVGVQGTLTNSTTTLVSNSLVGLVPPTASRVTIQCQAGGSAQSCAVGPNNVYTGGIFSTTPPPVMSSAASQGQSIAEFEIENPTGTTLPGVVYYTGSSSSSSAVVMGWEDNL